MNYSCDLLFGLFNHCDTIIEIKLLSITNIVVITDMELFDRVNFCGGSASVSRRRKAIWTPQKLSIKVNVPDHREKISSIQLACNESTTFM